MSWLNCRSCYVWETPYVTSFIIASKNKSLQLNKSFSKYCLHIGMWFNILNYFFLHINLQTLWNIVDVHLLYFWRWYFILYVLLLFYITFQLYKREIVFKEILYYSVLLMSVELHECRIREYSKMQLVKIYYLTKNSIFIEICCILIL